MADLSGLFVYFGALAFVALKIFSGMFLHEVAKDKGFVMGLFFKYVLPGILAMIILIFGYYAAAKCPSAGTIFAVGAVIVGGLPGLIVATILTKIPWTQALMSAAVAPIMSTMYILLVIYIVETVIGILSIFVVPLAPISMILNIVLPIVTLVILWSIFSGAFGSLPDCLGIGKAPTGPIPGTGGVKIGTYT